MTYVIHNGVHILKTCDSERGAKIGLTRKWKKKYPNAQVSSIEYFNKEVDHMVTVGVLGTDKTCQIRASEQGSVNDPSMELYWSF